VNQRVGTGILYVIAVFLGARFIFSFVKDPVLSTISLVLALAIVLCIHYYDKRKIRR
jgi:putative effector of murein hydrolase